jgi:hypothetical protein
LRERGDADAGVALGEGFEEFAEIGEVVRIQAEGF